MNEFTKVDYSKTREQLSGEAMKIMNVFCKNSIIEAIKEKEDPKIILSAEQSLNKKTVVRVADNGQGMPDEVIEKIFIPFFSTKKSGSGIGLSLCKQIMMLHKGSLQVQSVEGKGSVFSMQFS